MADLLEELSAEHLCTHFVLPLLKLSKFNFLSGSFINSYLTAPTGSTFLLVKVAEYRFLSRGLLEHPDFNALFTDENGYDYLMYGINRRWKGDLDYFRSGQYSVMSSIAKDMIFTYSKLPNKVVTPDGRIQTDMRLLALDRNPALREWWKREYDIDGFDGELLPKPDKEMYIALETLKEQL
jgi:hypothetical protein